jgi:hypothetical protein
VALGDTMSGVAFTDLADELIAKVDQRNREQRPTIKLQVTK